MELAVAIRLIEKGVDKTTQQTWADLGAGSGLFTKALSTVMESGIVYAVDKDKTDLSHISTKPSVQVIKIKADFASNLDIEMCDGILMANSLHFVSDKVTLISQLRKRLTAAGAMIIIEYERNTSNPWVPYPIRFGDLEKLMIRAGFSSVEKIGETPSVFDKSMMYSALVRQ